jgi:hypothetical protein
VQLLFWCCDEDGFDFMSTLPSLSQNVALMTGRELRGCLAGQDDVKVDATSS